MRVECLEDEEEECRSRVSFSPSYTLFLSKNLLTLDALDATDCYRSWESFGYKWIRQLHTYIHISWSYIRSIDDESCYATVYSRSRCYYVVLLRGKILKKISTFLINESVTLVKSEYAYYASAPIFYLEHNIIIDVSTVAKFLYNIIL